MPRLTDMKWSTTTVMDLLNDAEERGGEVFDIVYLELNTGASFMLAAVGGDDADAAHEMMEKLKEGEHPEAHLMEIAQGLTEWHAQRIGKIQKILATPKDTAIQFGEGDGSISLSPEQANGFRAGMQTALEWFEKFPLKVTPTGQDDEDD